MPASTPAPSAPAVEAVTAPPADEPAPPPADALESEPPPEPAASPVNPRRNAPWSFHREHFAAHVDFATARGLEIGAYDLPLVEPGEGACEFADFNDTAWLRAAAERTPGHGPEWVVPVAYSLREGYGAVPTGYDWIAASHVIEHVPDLLGWLRTLAEHLRPGGRLLLTVPDGRYTFDIHRRPTSLAQVVARHRAGLTKPSFEQVFDAYYDNVVVVAHDVWVGNPIRPSPHAYDVALKEASRTADEYVDAHCSVFTPDSFRALIDGLIAHGLVPYRVEELRGPPPGGWDFSVSLTRT